MHGTVTTRPGLLIMPAGQYQVMIPAVCRPAWTGFGELPRLREGTDLLRLVQRQFGSGMPGDPALQSACNKLGVTGRDELAKVLC